MTFILPYLRIYPLSHSFSTVRRTWPRYLLRRCMYIWFALSPITPIHRPQSQLVIICSFTKWIETQMEYLTSCYNYNLCRCQLLFYILCIQFLCLTPHLGQLFTHTLDQSGLLPSAVWTSAAKQCPIVTPTPVPSTATSTVVFASHSPHLNLLFRSHQNTHGCLFFSGHSFHFCFYFLIFLFKAISCIWV